MKDVKEMTYDELLDARDDCEERIATAVMNLDDVRNSLASNENHDEMFNLDLKEAEEILEDIKRWQGIQFDVERYLLRSDTEHNVPGGHLA